MISFLQSSLSTMRRRLDQVGCCSCLRAERNAQHLPAHLYCAADALLSPRLTVAPLAVLLFFMCWQPAFAENAEQGASRTGAPVQNAFDHDPLSGSRAVTTILRDDREEKADLLNLNILKAWKGWKAGIAESTGLSFGGDYLAVGFAATGSLGDDTSASGVARFFGSWELLNRGAANTGSVVFKIENRHAYTDIAPSAFGFDVGFVGTPEPVFNDDGFRATTLYWKQDFADDRALFRVGFLDMKEYFDGYALASPWTGFFNLAFTIGSNTMITLPDAALGAMVGGYLTDNIYAAASIIDAGFQPTSMFQGFDTFFGDFNTWKSAEIGITGGGKRFLFDNAHIAVWQQDESDDSGTQRGWGVNASVSHVVDGHWLPFLRAAWANEGGGLYEVSVSGGFGYQNKPGGNLLGVGLNWGRPNSDTFGVDLDDQLISEVFYRIQLTENFQITPNLQIVGNPALNPDRDVVALFGLRARGTF